MKNLISTLLFFHLFSIANAQCFPSVELNLDTNNINVYFFNGARFMNRYIAPKDSIINQNCSAGMLFNKNFWVTGYENDTLKLAVDRYSSTQDFVSGPYNESQLSSTHCNFYNNFFEISMFDLIQFDAELNSSNVPLSYSQIPQNILKWPAKGNTYLQTQGITIVDELAPFIDLNQNNIYDPENGDFPFFKGHKALMWVMNDNNVNSDRENNPLHVEVVAMAYAFNDNTNETINNSIFYDFTFKRKLPGSINDFIFSIYADYDIGVFVQNYIGCDTANNIGFTYNINYYYCEGYHDISYIKLIDNDSSLKLNSFLNLYSGNTGGMNHPQNNQEFRNIQEGNWKDGEPLYFGGNGRGNSMGATNNTTKYLFPSNTAFCDVDSAWTDHKRNPYSSCFSYNWGDRNMVFNLPPIDLEYNIPFQFTFAASSLNSNSGTSIFNSDSIFSLVSNDLQEYYDLYAKSGNFLNNLISSVEKIPHEFGFNLYPNPTNSTFKIKSVVDDYKFIKIFDLSGKLITVHEKSDYYDVNSFAKGIYIVKIYNNESSSIANAKLLIY